MLFSRIKKTNAADNVFQVVINKNASTAMTTGQVVVWARAGTTPAVTTAAAICTEVILNTTGPLIPCGVWADTSTAAGSPGLMQIYGYHSAVGADSATEGAMVIASATTAGRVINATNDATLLYQLVVGQCVVTAASNLAGVHIRLM